MPQHSQRANQLQAQSRQCSCEQQMYVKKSQRSYISQVGCLVGTGARHLSSFIAGAVWRPQFLTSLFTPIPHQHTNHFQHIYTSCKAGQTSKPLDVPQVFGRPAQTTSNRVTDAGMNMFKTCQEPARHSKSTDTDSDAVSTGLSSRLAATAPSGVNTARATASQPSCTQHTRGGAQMTQANIGFQASRSACYCHSRRRRQTHRLPRAVTAKGMYTLCSVCSPDVMSAGPQQQTSARVQHMQENTTDVQFRTVQ